MTQEERTKICSTCTEHKIDLKTGLYCGKTGNKPEFVNACYDYNADEAEIERKAKLNEEAKEIDGFLAFYLYFIVPFGLLAAYVSTLANWKVDTFNGNVFGILYVISVLLFFSYFQIYTIYAFRKRKSDAVFIAKYQLIFLILGNVLAIFTSGLDIVTWSFPVKILWGIIFLCYLFFSKDIEEIIPSKTRKIRPGNIVLIVLSIVIPIFFLVAASINIAMRNSPKARIEAACKTQKSQLPMEVAEGLYWTDISVKDNNVVFQYKLNEESSNTFKELGDDYGRLMDLYQKEAVRQNCNSIKDSDPIVYSICQTDYGMSYICKDAADKTLYSFTFSNDECMRMCADDYVYSTSEDDIQAIVDAFNKLLPTEYIEGGTLTECEYDGQMHFKIRLDGTDNSILAGLTATYLKDYMVSVYSYLTDAPTNIARWNGLDLVYDFSADCNSWWSISTTLTPSEYNAI